MIVAALILNWNNYKQTLSCLASLKKLINRDYDLKIIVVDNASVDNSAAEISKYKDIKLIRNNTNLGFSGGNNIGIKYALAERCDYIFILNNDTTVEPLIIQKLLESSSNNDAAIISPKIYFTKGREFHINRYKKHDLGKVIWFAGGIIDWDNVIGRHRGVDEVDKGQFDQENEIDYATGAGMFVKSEVFRKIGYFDDQFYLYYEDLDFCIRANESNIKIVFSPRAVMWHENAGSSYSGSGLQDYYITRNRLLIGSRYAPIKSRLALLKESMKLLIQGRKWQKIGVRDFFLRNYGKGSYG